MNMYELTEIPFSSEIAIEALLLENPQMLQIDRTLTKARIIRHEISLLDAAGREEQRINLLLQTERFCVMVKIVAGEINEQHVKELKRCLAQKEDIYSRYCTEKNLPTDWFGLFIGSHVSEGIQKSLHQGLSLYKCPIAAIILRQFQSSSSTPFLLREVLAGNFFKIESNQSVDTLPALVATPSKRTATIAKPKKKKKDKKRESEKDYTKYRFKGKSYNKGKLVNAVFQQIVAERPNITLTELQSYFPEKIHPGQKVFVLKEDAMRLKVKRHHLRPEQIIHLADADVCTSSQWSKDSLPQFIEHVKRQFGYEIESL